MMEGLMNPQDIKEGGIYRGYGAASLRQVEYIYDQNGQRYVQ